MRLREYEYMLAIADEKNMTRAAKRLFISQPALSKLLANIEAELGIRIFEQKDRRLVPTEAGKIYLGHARQMVEMNDQMEERIRQSKQKQEIRLACPMIYSQFVNNRVIPAFLARKTGFSLRMQHISQHNLRDCVQEDQSTIGIGMLTPEIERSLTCIPFGKIEMVLAVPVSDAPRISTQAVGGYDYPMIRAKDLEMLPFLFPREDSFSGTMARSYFQEHGLKPNIVYHCPITHPLYEMVASGAGVAILPSVPLKHMHLSERVCYFSLEGRPVQYTIGLVSKKDRALSEAEEQLVELVKELY